MFDTIEDIQDLFGLRKSAGEQALDAIARIRKMAEENEKKEKNHEN